MEKDKTLLIDDHFGKSLGNPDFFKDVVVASNEAIAVSEPGGRLIYVNPAHEKLFGRSLEVAGHSTTGIIIRRNPLKNTIKKFYQPSKEGKSGRA